MPAPSSPVKIYLSHAPEDEPFCERLERHLSVLHREGQIGSFRRSSVAPGEDPEAAMKASLEDADVILLLVSADFLASRWCAEIELPAALARSQSRLSHVIPVILRACDWRHAPFGGLKVLPRDGKPVHRWDDQDEALAEVAREIRETIAMVRAEQTPAVPSAILPRSPSKADPQPPGASYNPAWYVPRTREEREALNALSFAGKPAVLWGPSRFGKTWLLNHCLDHVRQNKSFDSVLVDLRLLNRQSFDVLLHELASCICEERIEQPEEALSEAWSRPGTASTRITRLLERRVLPVSERGLVLAIDGVDEVWRSSFQDDLCALLRAWAESCHGPWPRLRLMLAVSTTPALLISDPDRSPFNLSAPTVIGDLDATQVVELAQHYELPWTGSAIEQVMQLVGGHPYLVRLLMHRAALHNTPLPELLDASLGPRWVLHEDVQRMRLALERSGLKQIAARVLQDPKVALDLVDYQRVTRAGVVVEETPGRLRLRNRLYEIAIAGRL
jgi:hypothetical protein